MKTVLYLFIFLLISSYSYGQLTMQSFTPPGNGQPFSGNWTVPTTNGVFTHDLGTHVYYQYQNISGGIFRNIYIIRQNNIWKILERQNGPWIGGTSYLDRFHAKTPSSEIDPPCNDIWEVNTGLSFNTLPPSGIPVSNPSPGDDVEIFLSGTTCVNLPHSTSFTAFHNRIQIPTLPSTDISAIQNPKQGQLTFDEVTKSLNLHDGIKWNSIYSQNGNFNSGGDFSVPIDSKVIFGPTVGTGEYIQNYNHSTHGKGLMFFTGNQPKLKISSTGKIRVSQDYDLPISTLEVNGSQGVKTSLHTSDFTLNDNSHTAFYTGAGNHTCTLPSASSALGRIYFITNHSGGGLLFSSSIKTGISSTINTSIPGETLHIVSDGTDWRKIN